MASPRTKKKSLWFRRSLIFFGIVFLFVVLEDRITSRLLGNNSILHRYRRNSPGTTEFVDTGVFNASSDHAAFDSLLSLVARNRTVVITPIDHYIFEFAINYARFARRANIDYYIMLTATLSKQYLKDRDMTAFVTPDKFSPPQGQQFLAAEFYKAKYAFETLRRGYDVIVTDLDLVFLRDPLAADILNEPHDIATSLNPYASNGVSRTEGSPPVARGNFVHIRSNSHTLEFARLWLEMVQKDPQHVTLNDVFAATPGAVWVNHKGQTSFFNDRNSGGEHTLRVEYLDPKTFTFLGSWTKDYSVFGPYGERDPKSPALTVDIGAGTCSLSAKRFRARHWGLWWADKAAYYHAKVVRYQPRATAEKFNWEEEAAAFRIALGVALSLKRALILPFMPCRLNKHLSKWLDENKWYLDTGQAPEWCTWDQIVNLNTLRNHGYENFLRESMLLEDPRGNPSWKSKIHKAALTTGKEWNDRSIQERMRKLDNAHTIDLDDLTGVKFVGFSQKTPWPNFNEHMKMILDVSNQPKGPDALCGALLG